MLALGLCNICGSFVRSMPITGSFTRTAVNNASGVKTPMGGVVTGGLVLLACGLLTSTFKFIPKATLAAVIIIAMFYMFETRIFVVLWRTKSKILIALRLLSTKFSLNYTARSMLRSFRLFILQFNIPIELKLGKRKFITIISSNIENLESSKLIRPKLYFFR